MVLLLWAGIEMAFRKNPDLTRNQTDRYWLDRPRCYYEAVPEAEHWWTRGCTNRLRILVLGDSFTAGMGIEADDRFTERLERWLNAEARTPPAEVLNLGRPGTSTYQQIALLRAGLKRKPDVVILTMCLNDMEDWTRPKEVLAWLTQAGPSRPTGLAQFLSDRSLAAGWAISRAYAWVAKPRYLEYYRKIYDSDYFGWRRFVKSAEIFEEACEAANTPLVVVIMPLFSHDLREGRYPFEYCHEAIKGVWQKHQVPVLDLYDAFKGMLPVRLQAVPGLDPHPNEIAHRVAAEAVLLFLVEQQLIPASYRPHVLVQLDRVKKRAASAERLGRLHGQAPEHVNRP
jgi:lysophospholipase L1-like esterase